MTARAGFSMTRPGQRPGEWPAAQPAPPSGQRGAGSTPDPAPPAEEPLAPDATVDLDVLRRDTAGELTPLAGEVVKLNDQHAFLTIAATTPLAVGDLVCLGVSHPCTALDHWRLAPLLDDDRRVVDCVRLYF